MTTSCACWTWRSAKLLGRRHRGWQQALQAAHDHIMRMLHLAQRKEFHKKGHALASAWLCPQTLRAGALLHEMLMSCVPA